MRILAVGGGSGGHVTPIAAVLKALKAESPNAEMRVWCDKKFAPQTRQTITSIDDSIRVDVIASGKLRRYYTLPLWKQFLRFRTIVFPNIRDGIFITIGVVQSFFKLLFWRPDVIFCKGGYVCLPVGLAGKLLRIPIVLHDSDAHPGLTNRILSRFASAIATGAPLKYYHYPEAISTHVGIPINARFKRYSENERSAFKAQLGFNESRPLVLITGGGLGAQTINSAVAAVLGDLTKSMNVLLLSGESHFEEINRHTAQYDASQFQVHAFISSNIVEALAAADVVVARAGATTLLELAALAKPTVIIPNPYLTGGHQLKNAAVYAEKNAAVIIEEAALVASPNNLLDTLNALILNHGELQRMGDAIHEFARPDAAVDTARIILSARKA